MITWQPPFVKRAAFKVQKRGGSQARRLPSRPGPQTRCGHGGAKADVRVQNQVGEASMDKLGSVVQRLLRENWLFLLIVGALAVAFLTLRTSPSDVSSLEEVDALLNSGQPAMVEFYSNT
jgi:hypothetical protein